ncbi:3-oxoacyl-ACP synthase [Legionella quinlivanii]|uniref:3-oxoacyl-ACP synthase n=1 Tax=Legionella quinlivanii TaxID=45073 RepID=A0A364LG84_9GAMM|nr:beta-ketoacyl synthase N-terminal-like domain-containing protein [Legionella quinlivanii]RAP35143.1 3-oxoacyl-ACP synthase [Legionella quinlivanii]
MNNEKKRVFITGLSALTACGETLDKTWNAILAGETGIEEIRQWDLSSWSARLGGELKDFQPGRALPDRKLMKVISRHDAMGIHAAVEAIKHSGMIDYRDSLESAEHFNEQTAVFVGSPGNKYFQQYDFLPLLAKSEGNMQEFAAQLFNEVHPMWLLRILPNNVLAYSGITYGFKGPNHNITNHAAGGIQALIEAYHTIQQGQADRAVVVAYDAGVEPQALFYYNQLGVLSERHLKPFDKDHDGTVLAEGATALILESEESARARGAVCLAEVAGGLASTEAAGLFSLEAEGASLAILLQQALASCNLNAADIDLIVAHGNGNAKSDLSEAFAIQELVQGAPVPVTAYKWAMGHTLTAAGLLDTVLTTRAITEKCIPGIANLTEPAAQCAELNLSASTREFANQRTALIINRGFASMNACVVIKSCD